MALRSTLSGYADQGKEESHVSGEPVGDRREIDDEID